MKKFYTLFIAMVVVNGTMGQDSIPTLSFHACTKNDHPAFNLQHRTSDSLVNVQDMMGNIESKESDIEPGKNLFQPVKPQNSGNRDLIQIFDSTYHWVWDTQSIGWKIESRISDMVYDAHKNLISETYKILIGSIWESDKKYTYAYDANNNQTSKLRQDWYGTYWWNNNLYTYTYDENNNQTSYTYQVWNVTSWENVSLYTFTYDANSNMTNSLWQVWRNGSAWENNRQYIRTYDANNNMTSGLWQNWNGSVWENAQLFSYTYDVNNNQTSELSQVWINSAWKNYDQYSNTYDDNNFTKSSSFRKWDEAGNQVISGDSAHYYFHTNVGINDVIAQDGSIAVYPNPTSTNITLETTVNGHLTILNLIGQQLLTRQITEPKTQIDISTLPRGVYIVRLTGNRKVEVGKIIKQ